MKYESEQKPEIDHVAIRALLIESGAKYLEAQISPVSMLEKAAKRQSFAVRLLKTFESKYPGDRLIALETVLAIIEAQLALLNKKIEKPKEENLGKRLIEGWRHRDNPFEPVENSQKPEWEEMIDEYRQYGKPEAKEADASVEDQPGMSPKQLIEAYNAFTKNRLRQEHRLENLYKHKCPYTEEDLERAKAFCEASKKYQDRLNGKNPNRETTLEPFLEYFIEGLETPSSEEY